jgi:3-dehydroquinate dehydratase
LRAKTSDEQEIINWVHDWSRLEADISMRKGGFAFLAAGLQKGVEGVMQCKHATHRKNRYKQLTSAWNLSIESKLPVDFIHKDKNFVTHLCPEKRKRRNQRNTMLVNLASFTHSVFYS